MTDDSEKIIVLILVIFLPVKFFYIYFYYIFYKLNVKVLFPVGIDEKLA